MERKGNIRREDRSEIRREDTSGGRTDQERGQIRREDTSGVGTDQESRAAPPCWPVGSICVRSLGVRPHVFPGAKQHWPLLAPKIVHRIYS